MLVSSNGSNLESARADEKLNAIPRIYCFLLKKSNSN
jgi:hypothetical protein